MSDMAIETKPRKISVPEYHRMVEAGILHEGERVELLDGIIVEMSPLGRRHVALHTRIARYLTIALRERAAISGQISVPLGELNEPQPDIVVLAADAAERMDRYPEIEEMYAFIEIAESSLRQDLGQKQDLYARFGIREYLVIDIDGRRLLRFTDPSEGRFGTRQELGYGDSFSLRTLPEIILQAEAFLPPPEPASQQG